MYTTWGGLSHVQLTGGFGTLQYLKQYASIFLFHPQRNNARIICTENKKIKIKPVYLEVTNYESLKLAVTYH